MHEIANGTRDLFVFVQGEGYDWLLGCSTVVPSAYLPPSPTTPSASRPKPKEQQLHVTLSELRDGHTYDETDRDPLPCRNAMRGPIATCVLLPPPLAIHIGLDLIIFSL